MLATSNVGDPLGSYHCSYQEDAARLSAAQMPLQGVLEQTSSTSTDVSLCFVMPMREQREI